MQRLMVIGLALSVWGCAPTVDQLAKVDLSDPRAECAGPADQTCFFLNSPVSLTAEPVRINGRWGTFYPIARQLDFVDGQQRRWVAPARTLTDGASIPRIFVPLVGSPRTPEFVNAAAVHDAYCGIGNEIGSQYHAETWQAVHRMFYDTLIVGGTEEIKAKIMFAAVWLGGPRWYPVRGDQDRWREEAPASVLIAEMERTIHFIETQKPSVSALVRYMEDREADLIREIEAYSDRRGLEPATVSAPVDPVVEVEVKPRPGGGQDGVGAVRGL